MLAELRRVIIAAQYRADPQVDPTPEQSRPSAWPGQTPLPDCET
jgi:hypothetical protein